MSQIKAYPFKRHLESDESNDENLEISNFYVETVRKIFSSLSNYNQSFDFRTRLIDIGIAVKMMIYPKYILVNKTSSDIEYGESCVFSRTNDFLMSKEEHDKMKFKVKGYEESEPITLGTIGLNKVLYLNSESKDCKYD